jgi:plasmid maintenance system antidote protein VapI
VATAQLWLNLQTDYDVQVAKRDLGKILDRIETVNKPKAAWSAEYHFAGRRRLAARHG